MNKQELFNKAISWVIYQKYIGQIHTTDEYHTGNTNRDIIGVLIPTNYYRKSLEGQPILAILDSRNPESHLVLLKHFKVQNQNDVKFLQDLQDAYYYKIDTSLVNLIEVYRKWKIGKYLEVRKVGPMRNIRLPVSYYDLFNMYTTHILFGYPTQELIEQMDRLISLPSIIQGVN